MIIPHYYEDPHMLHENTMPNRAYYVPASKRMDNLIEHREESDRLQSLNGNWKFRYYESAYDLQDEFYKTDYPVEEYDTVRYRVYGRITVMSLISISNPIIHFR